MALHHFSEESGHLAWWCAHCWQENTAHVSHPEVRHLTHPEPDHVIAQETSTDENGLQHTHTVTRPNEKKETINPNMIALPACSCGSRTYLKATFTQDELAAPNMIDETGTPTESHRVAHRHMALAQKLRATPEERRAPDADEQPQAQYPLVVASEAPAEVSEPESDEPPTPGTHAADTNPLAGID